MRRVMFSLVLLALFGALAAQPPVPPTPAVPATPPVTPATVPATLPPTATGELTFAQFDPLNSFPSSTQSAVPLPMPSAAPAYG